LYTLPSSVGESGQVLQASMDPKEVIWASKKDPELVLDVKNLTLVNSIPLPVIKTFDSFSVTTTAFLPDSPKIILADIDSPPINVDRNFQNATQITDITDSGSVATIGNQFIYVNRNGTKYLKKSTDGIVWSDKIVPSAWTNTSGISSLFTVPGLVIMQTGNNESESVHCSYDGDTWFPSTGITRSIRGPVAGNGLIVTNVISNVILISFDDGPTWKEFPVPGSSSNRRVAFLNGTFYLYDTENICYTSEDAITWKEQTYNIPALYTTRELKTYNNYIIIDTTVGIYISRDGFDFYLIDLGIGISPTDQRFTFLSANQRNESILLFGLRSTSGEIQSKLVIFQPFT
jgi:hypothetical protein